MENLVRCPWLDDVRSMAEKAGESLRKCEVHSDQLMTHFDTEKKRPACKNCAEENKNTVCTLEEAKQRKEDAILKERYSKAFKIHDFSRISSNFLGEYRVTGN